VYSQREFVAYTLDQLGTVTQLRGNLKAAERECVDHVRDVRQRRDQHGREDEVAGAKDVESAEPTPRGAVDSLTAYLNPYKVVLVEVGGTDELVVEEVGCLGSSGLRPGRSTTA
jgi:hypothetical protein